MALQLSALVAANKQRWASARFHQSMYPHAKSVANRLLSDHARAIYQALEERTKVPWWVIALIHEREAQQNWKANIANGQRYDHVTTIEPKGRGPFHTFVDAAIDALEKAPPHASRWKDWTAGGALTLLELYNGEGYELYHHMASPYLWNGTQHYTRGKYDRDGHFNSSMVDGQLGCAVLLRAMMDLDPSILAGTHIVQPEDGSVAQHEAPDPEQYPEPSQDPVPPPAPPVPAAPEDPPPLPKPITQSKIASAQAGIGAGGALVIFSQMNEALQQAAAQVTQARGSVDELGLSDVLSAAMHKPMFLFAVVVVILAGVTIYWRWKDHGRGSTK